MIVPVMAISNLVLTRQIYSEETNGAHAHYREPVPLMLIHLGKIQLPWKGGRGSLVQTRRNERKLIQAL